MKYITLFIGLFLLFFSVGCGYVEGAKTSTQKSYIYFSGNATNLLVSIDKSEKFVINPDDRKHQYALKPGKHLVEVYKDNAIILKREIFLSDGIIKEIELH